MFMSLDEAIQTSYDACASNDENKLGRCLDAGLGIDDKHTWIIHIKKTFNWTLLYLACVMRTPKMVRYLLERGADVSAGSSWDGSISMEHVIMDILRGELFHMNEYQKSLEIASMLIDFSDVNAKLPVLKKTPLQAALASPALVKYLIHAGCDIHIRDNNGMTMLMLAADGGNIITMRLLIEAGVDIEERDNNPLPRPMSTHVSAEEHVSVQTGHRLQFERSGRNFNMRSIYRLLVDRFCNDNTQHGWTVLDYARESGNSAVIDVIETELLHRNSQVAFAMIGLQRLAEEAPTLPLGDDMIREILGYVGYTEEFYVPGLPRPRFDAEDVDAGHTSDHIM